jgi:guanidinoacetate N-methyltransferase
MASQRRFSGLDTTDMSSQGWGLFRTQSESPMPTQTIETRKRIGFPRKRSDWAKAPAVYSQRGLRILGHPVMQWWELEYMSHLARIVTRNGGTILEVGYGLGLSAREIQKRRIKTHYVIECHPEVVRHCLGENTDAIAESRLHVLVGFWEDLAPLLKSESFEGILFDTYPLKEKEIHCNHFPFFREAYRLLKPGGILTYWSDEASSFPTEHVARLRRAGFKSENIRSEVVEVDPPKDCEYWQGKTLLVPQVSK